MERGEPVETALTLGVESGWRVVLAVSPDEETTLTQAAATFRVALAPADLKRLLAPEAEGVYFQQEAAPGVRYYVEKDFPCVHPRAIETQEPPTDTFAAPEDFEARKGTTSGE